MLRQQLRVTHSSLLDNYGPVFLISLRSLRRNFMIFNVFVVKKLNL